jgi:DNA invertase Pin-like site-specific DNA recombinase
MPNKITALYCRCSKPDPGAITRQREALRRFAGEQGFSGLTVYNDDGRAATEPRPALEQLEQDIRDGKVARLLVTDVSRIDLSTAVVVRWLVWLRRHGVDFYTLDDRADWQPILAALEGVPVDD